LNCLSWLSGGKGGGGNCSNMASRTLTVNSTTMSCGRWALPSKRNGGYCIQVTAGSPDYASFATW
jgi:hypothetical protein